MVSAKRTPFRLSKRGEIWHAYISAVIGDRRVIIRESARTGERDQAIAYCVRRLSELQNAPDITHEITLDAAAARWLIEVGQYQAQRQSREYVLDVLLREMNRNILLSEITKADINHFVENCRAKGRKAATINRYLAALSALFSQARDYWDCRVPAFKVSKFKQKEPVESVKYFADMDEIKRIADSAAKHLRPIILTAVYTGLRMGRILSLKWDQVDFDNMQIVFIGKNGLNQSVPMVPQLRELLESLPRVSGFVFMFRGQALKSIKAGWRAACDRAGIEYKNFHTLRHTTATWLLRDSKDLRLVKEVLGHKTIQTTLKYAHLANDHKAEGLNHLFRAKKKATV
jgi:integrase